MRRRGRSRLRCLCLAGLMSLSVGVVAQTVYRCGPAGNSYSQQPCPEGRVVDVSDPRSPAQVNEARSAWREQERWALRAARERRAEEAANPPAGAAGIGPAPAAAARQTVSPRNDSAKPKKRPLKAMLRSDDPSLRDGGFVAVPMDGGKPARPQR